MGGDASIGAGSGDVDREIPNGDGVTDKPGI